METNNSGGIGFLGILQIIFITLKATNLISWTWWVVFTPTFISIGLVILVFAIFIIAELINKLNRKKRRKK